jgi:DNA invertase Pin-like site-specific DNA recombinase
MIRVMSERPTHSPDPTPPPIQRCAVYTRMSFDGSEEDKFDSINAQFIACHDFIASQIGRGWAPVDRIYEDRGYSGGNTRRPGLQQLISDIESNLIDVVLVYRLDRLSRHTPDLSRLMVTFKRHGVALGFVTQPINTAEPQGRLALHLLTSFAQFERELAAERNKYKYSAARAQGLWQGSASPLGYSLEQQRLVVHASEAQTVRSIFERFVAQPSVTDLVKDLRDQAVKTKAWKTKTGQIKGGREFDKNALYKLLNNRMYLGEIFYDGQWHPGIHVAIIDQPLWDSVHDLMQSRARRAGIANKSWQEDMFPLRGLIFGEDGRSMSPWLSSKQRGRHFSYYVHQAEITVGAGASGLPRISAPRLHAQVIEYLREHFRDPTPWLSAMPQALLDEPTFDQARIRARFTGADQTFDYLTFRNQGLLMRKLVERVVIGPNDFLIQIRLSGVFDLITELFEKVDFKNI